MVLPMRTFTDETGRREILPWWDQQKEGDTVIKIIAPFLGCEKIYGDDEAYRAWLEHSADPVAASLAVLQEPQRLEKWSSAYGNHARRTIKRKVRIIRILLLDEKAVEQDPSGPMAWWLQVFNAAFLGPQTGEEIWTLPLASATKMGLPLDTDTATWGQVGVQYTRFDAVGNITRRVVIYGDESPTMLAQYQGATALAYERAKRYGQCLHAPPDTA